MNQEYKTKYDLLIESILLLNRGLKKEKNHGKYFNIHHIKPKSLGGTDQESNLIKLTHKEHYLAHKYLYFVVTYSMNSNQTFPCYNPEIVYEKTQL